MACGAVAGITAWATGRNGLVRFITLTTVFATILYAVADLNGYVVGFGPEGEDWVKNRSEWDVERLLECGVLAGLAGGIGCIALWTDPGPL